jgi:hypothetical protein
MRAQYHFRQSDKGLRAWSVSKLVLLSQGLPRERVALTAIRELDEPYWTTGHTKGLTCREVSEHAQLIRDCDPAFPVILSSDGRVMDGMHRVCRALLDGRMEVEAVRFPSDPEPDFVGVHPDDLPYGD